MGLFELDYSYITLTMLSGLLGSALYIYYRIVGKTDEELIPDEYKTDTMELQNGQILFGGKAKYASIALDDISKVSYTPTDDDYQELTFTFKEKGGFVYSLNNSVDYVSDVVDVIDNNLSLNAEKN